VSIFRNRPAAGASLCCLIAFALTVPACGPSGPEMARVRGKVTIKGGGPMTRGTVSFASTDPARANASSQVGADGTYDLQTREPGDGAQLGEYKVTVSDVETSQILDYIPKKPVAKPKALISSKYGSAETTPLSATVKRGSNTFDFELDPGE
jgi:hypothetical protein